MSPTPRSAKPLSKRRRESEIRERPRVSPRLVLRCLSEAVSTDPRMIYPMIEELKRNIAFGEEASAPTDLSELFLEALNAVLRLEPSKRWRHASVIFACYTRQTDLRRVAAVDLMENTEPIIAPGPQGLSLLLKIALSVDMASRKQERLAIAARDTPDLPVIVQAWREYKRYSPDGSQLAASDGRGEAAARSLKAQAQADFWLKELDRVARATQKAAEAATEEIHRRRRSRQREAAVQ